MDDRYGTLYSPTFRATRVERATLEAELRRHQTRLAGLRAEERGTVKLSKTEKAYLWGAQEYAKTAIREIRAQLGMAGR